MRLKSLYAFRPRVSDRILSIASFKRHCRQLVSLVLIAALILPSARSQAANPLDQHLETVLNPTQTQPTAETLIRQLDYRSLSENDELMSAFIAALTDDDNTQKVQNLAMQMERNEGTYMRLLEALIKKASENPEIIGIAERNAERLQKQVRNLQIQTPDVGMRVYEMGVFSLTYLALVYSLHGLGSEYASGPTDLITGYSAIITLMALAGVRQSINLTVGIRGYFKRLKERRAAGKFLKGFREWIQGAQETGDLKTTALLLQLHQYAMVTPDRFNESHKVMGDYYSELEKLNRMGLLAKFKNYLSTRKFKNRMQKMLALMSRKEWEKFQHLHPDSNQVIKVEHRSETFLYYETTRREILSWLAAETNDTSILRSRVQEHLNGRRDEAIKQTHTSLYEKISTHALTLGSLFLGLTMAVNSGVIPQLDPLLPGEFLALARDQDSRLTIELAMMFLPAFGLALHEFDFVLARAFNRPARQREKRRQIHILEGILDHLTTIERELPTTEAREKAVKELGLLVNHGESAGDLLERLEKRASLRQCREALLK
jgi:hypothetical protein